MGCPGDGTYKDLNGGTCQCVINGSFCCEVQRRYLHVKVSVSLEFTKDFNLVFHPKIPGAKSHGGTSKLPWPLGPAESEEPGSDWEGAWLSVRTLTRYCFPIATNLAF